MCKVFLKRPIPKKITKAAAREYDRMYAQELKKVQSLIDAAEAAGRITAADLAVVVNY